MFLKCILIGLLFSQSVNDFVETSPPLSAANFYHRSVPMYMYVYNIGISYIHNMCIRIIIITYMKYDVLQYYIMYIYIHAYSYIVSGGGAVTRPE